MLVLLAVALRSGTAHAQTLLCDSIRAMTAEPAVAAAHWGVSVVGPDGTQLCSLNETQLFRPASAAKLFTSAAALALLGPDHTFTTSVIAEGRLSGSTLTGDLVLRGGGDPAFGAPLRGSPDTATIADLEQLAAQVAATGLREVKGAVLGDDTYFVGPMIPPNWAADDLVFGFAAPPSALTLHDNSVTVKVAAAATGNRAALSVTPAVSFDTLDNQVSQGSQVPQGRADQQTCDQRLVFRRAAGSHTVVVSGSVSPQARTPCLQAVAIDTPAQYAAEAFRQALERHGIRVKGPARVRSFSDEAPGSLLTPSSTADFVLDRILQTPGPKSTSCSVQRVIHPGDPPDPVRTTLATHTSAPLLEDLTRTVKSSQNLHAELYLREVGAALGCEHSLREALHGVRRYLLLAGLAADDFVLYDGSGLSDHDLVTPRAFTTFLTFAAGQPWFAQWKAMLPVGGVDGTLSARFPGGLKGKVFAKTGTLGESRVLAGYATAASGASVRFAILVDNHLPGTTTDRAVMDRMVEAIAAAN